MIRWSHQRLRTGTDDSFSVVQNFRLEIPIMVTRLRTEVEILENLYLYDQENLRPWLIGYK